MTTAGRNFLDGKVTLLAGDCLELLASLPENSIDSVVTDPPYHLTSIVKRFGKPGSAPVKVDEFFDAAENSKGASPYLRGSVGFMGKQWDGGDVAFRIETWEQVLRVLKPGGHLIAFSGTRTYHRMVCAIEDAGFEIRDQIGWCFGSGFPKSHDVSKGIDKAAGREREVIRERWQGWGTALKPAWEPICLARKPLIGTVAANVLEHGVGALNIDGCRVEAEGRPLRELDAKATNSNVYSGRTGEGGLGKGLDGGSKAVGTTDLGRWPANLILSDDEEVIAAFPDGSSSGHWANKATGFDDGRAYNGRGADASDSGSAARFFYTAKADAEDRLGSKHPTVKPLDLMQWLVRLVTPKGGTCLDPFAGTGTTGEAAWREGMRAILIEREPEYQADIARRMELATNPTKRAAVAATKNNLDKPEDLPLFSGAKA